MSDVSLELNHLTAALKRGALSRRAFLGRAGALGLSATAMAALIAVADAVADETPRKGGLLRLGLAGGSTTDSFDPGSWNDSVMISAAYGIFNALVENGPDNRPIPELAQSYEAKDGAKTWIFNLRTGVTFHNGKTFGAEDVIYSLNLHRGASTSGAAGFMKNISAIKKLTNSQIQIELAEADADLPSVLTDYHLVIVPEGFKDFAKPIGTGAFTLESFDPGVRVAMNKNRNFWKDGRGHLDRVEITVINDGAARLSALTTGQIDAMNRADPKTIALIARNDKLQLVRATGGWHAVCAATCDTKPFDNNDLRLALKYGIDRDQINKTIFSGYASLGNDHPIPASDFYYNASLAQTAYDADKAKFHLKKSGFDGKVVLQASDTAFTGAVDMASLYQASASKAGINFEVKREPADGFWNNVWLKGAFVLSYWGGRPSATQMLAVAYKSDAPWNETHFKRADFDNTLAQARAETDENKRKPLIFAMQEMLNKEGGAIVPVFKDWLDVHAKKVGGHTPHSGYDMDNGRIAEKAWIIS